MRYDPSIHHRRSVRLRGYDYSQEGAYFITICAQDRRHAFGKVENAEMVLNEFGQIAHREWENLPGRWPHLEMGAFQIMPNHMHGIVVINSMTPDIPVNKGEGEGDGHSKGWERRPTIGQITGAYKSRVLTECLKWIKANRPDMVLGKLWQRNLWEHVIQDDAGFDKITDYIIDNPKNWHLDKFFAAP